MHWPTPKKDGELIFQRIFDILSLLVDAETEMANAVNFVDWATINSCQISSGGFCQHNDVESKSTWTILKCFQQPCHVHLPTDHLTRSALLGTSPRGCPKGAPLGALLFVKKDMNKYFSMAHSQVKNFQKPSRAFGRDWIAMWFYFPL